MCYSALGVWGTESMYRAHTQYVMPIQSLRLTNVITHMCRELICVTGSLRGLNRLHQDTHRHTRLVHFRVTYVITHMCRELICVTGSLRGLNRLHQDTHRHARLVHFQVARASTLALCLSVYLLFLLTLSVERDLSRDV